MAHEHHPPSRERFGEAGAAAHASADAEYLVTPAGSGHEHSDANVWDIVRFGLWLTIAAIVVHVGMWLMFVLSVERREGAEPQFPLAQGQERRLPAQPRLQSIPVNDIYRFRVQEENVLRNYRWIDREGGRVQIPISEAMRVIVERGLPARAEPPAAPSLLPADSSAGRTTERRRQ
jgi:hypothetical protein